MELAKCTLNSKTYDAYEFSKLSDREISEKRKHLVCKSCDAKAYFKKRSKSGQAACFGARPHNDGCNLATEESQTCRGILQDDEKELINDGAEIEVNFDFSVKPITHIADKNNDDIDTDKERRGSRHSSQNGIGTAKSKRNLKSLLNMLLNAPNFSQSEQIINIEKYSYKAKNLFKEFSELTDNDTFRGVYGQIFDVNEYNNTIWINSGGYNDCSIRIDADLHNDFYGRFEEYNDLEELNGKYVLCFGYVNKSKKDKYYIKLDDISKIIFK